MHLLVGMLMLASPPTIPVVCLDFTVTVYFSVSFCASDLPVRVRVRIILAQGFLLPSSVNAVLHNMRDVFSGYRRRFCKLHLRLHAAGVISK